MPSVLYLLTPGLYQLAHLYFIVTVRPFQKIKDNIVEIFNETIFTIFLLGLSYFNKEEKWSDVFVDMYSNLMMVPGVFLLLISISKF
jgi:hypothetical protein